MIEIKNKLGLFSNDNSDDHLNNSNLDKENDDHHLNDNNLDEENDDDYDSNDDLEANQISTKKIPSTASNNQLLKHKNNLNSGMVNCGSPQFGNVNIIIKQVEYQIGKYICYKDNNGRKLGRLLAILNDSNNYKLKGQHIVLTYNKLPRQFKAISDFKEFRLI
ncbi:hypothetical protein C1646_751292 [Rhizophagus diaphanus]|nr:hypothetical protein C1646_751292 [Rhizophagus diaphanus] [Rhizophagus sp. MUCL 43196]